MGYTRISQIAEGKNIPALNEDEKVVKSLAAGGGGGEGGGGGVISVVVGGTIQSPTFDKTGDEVIEAINQNKIVKMLIPRTFLGSSDDNGYFECIGTVITRDGYSSKTIYIFERALQSSMPFNKITCFEWIFFIYPSEEGSPSQISDGEFHKYTIAVTEI